MRVELKRGKERDLPNFANVGTLLFTYDTGRIFGGNGYGKPLTEYSSFLSGYNNIADLEFKNPQIMGKIYLTNDGGLYIYNGDKYISVGGGTGSGATDVYEKTWSNQFNGISSKILDIRDLFLSQDMRSITASEILIENTGSESLDFLVKDKEIVVLETKIKTKETQKYLLGISTNLKVFVKGHFNGQLYINYYKNAQNT